MSAGTLGVLAIAAAILSLMGYAKYKAIQATRLEAELARARADKAAQSQEMLVDKLTNEENAYDQIRKEAADRYESVRNADGRKPDGSA